MVSDRKDGLYPTVVCDESGKALGLCWSNDESIKEAIESRKGVYHSRKRGMWKKGESSGNTQELLKIDLDCDNDSLRFTVRQKGKGFCHKDTWTCWGEDSGINKLYKRLLARKENAPEGSYTKRLFKDQELLNAKITEEAGELIEALQSKNKKEICLEAADLIYFVLTALAKNDVTLTDIENILDKRSMKISRRPGDAKTGKRK
jgi:phosphoribosyl-ATP pyrophosphohydrolase